MKWTGIAALLLMLQEPPGWKRLEEALRPPAQKTIDITSWPDLRPLEELSSPEAAALLEKYADQPDQLALATRVERVLFQRLLWAFFDGHHRSWTTFDSDHPRLQKRLVGPPKQPKPERLLRLSARLIRQLALPEEEIHNCLPRPYFLTVDSGMYPNDFDPAKPTQPFLPRDLWRADGHWISLGNSAELPLALRHTAYFGGRSSFQIFLRAPEGRNAGLELVKSLRHYRGENPSEAPTIPAGTQLAIVEEPLIVSEEGKLVPSLLTETVEIRVIRKPALRFDHENAAHAVFRFRLRPDLLVSGDPAPLRARGKEMEDWEPVTLLVDQAHAGPWTSRSAAVSVCHGCHSMPQAAGLGIASRRVRPKESGTLEVVDPHKERERALRWKEKEADWKELRSYWK
jgi:hypothetical protein